MNVEPEIHMTVTEHGTRYYHVSQAFWGRRFATRDAALEHLATLIPNEPMTRRTFLARLTGRNH